MIAATSPRRHPTTYDGNPSGGASGGIAGGGSTAGSSAGDGADWWPWSWSPEVQQDALAVLAGIGAGLLVTAAVLAVGACTVVTFGVCGVGAGVAVAALVAGGVAGSLVTYHYSSGEKTPEGYVNSAVVGSITGLAGPALGPVVRTLLGKVTTGATSAASSATAGASSATVGAAGSIDDVARTIDLFRHVSPNEAADIAASGFAEGPNSLSGKWFAEIAEDAMQWGSLLNQGDGALVQVRVPSSFAESLFRVENLDGIGAARYVPSENFAALNTFDRTIK